MPTVDERGNRIPAPKSKSKPKPKEKPKPAKSWRNIIIAGGASIGHTDYWTGRAGVAGRGGVHTGEDIGRASGGSFGATIRTPLGGTVVAAGYGAGGGSAFGNSVLIQLESGDFLFFAHMATTPAVRKGDKIKAGTPIGRVGSTGNSSGPHLHLEVRTKASGGNFSRSKNSFKNPVTYLDQVTKGMVYDDSGEPKIKSANDSTTKNESRTSSRSGSGGGAGVGKSGFSKAEFYADLGAMFGDLNVLLAMDDAAVKENGGKSIRWAIDQAVRQKLVLNGAGVSRFTTLLGQTAWFKKYGQKTTERMIEQKSKPELFTKRKNATKATIAADLAKRGVVLNDAQLDSLARDAYIYQWGEEGGEMSEASLIDRVQAALGKGGGQFVGGEIGEAEDVLDEIGRLFGVKVSDSDVAQLRNDILDGLGGQRMKDVLQERSAQTYSVFADQIREGVNVRTLADAYFRQAGELLELSPEQIDWDDPLFTMGRAFQTTDQKTGKVVQRTLADFLQMVRKDERWGKTDNAKKTAAELASGLLHQMGLL